MSTASKVASKKSTKKVAKKTAAKKGTDLILNIIHRVENITKEKFGTKIAELREGRDEEFFEMGGYLTVAMEKGWHRDAGYTDFRDWIGDKHGLNARSGRHMMTVYQKVTDAELEWKDVDGVGWTKLRTLASIMTKENAKKLLKGAKDLTTRELEKFVKDQNPRARTWLGCPSRKRSSWVRWANMSTNASGVPVHRNTRTALHGWRTGFSVQLWLYMPREELVLYISIWNVLLSFCV